MKELLKRIKADVLISSVVCILLGVLLLFKADMAVNLVCVIIALTLIILGVVYIIGFLTSHFVNMIGLIGGLLMLIFGIWFYVKPEVLASLIPCVIGLILVVHGMNSIRIATETKNNNYDKWWSVLLAALLTIILGVLIIVFAFRVATFAVQILGVALIYDAVANFWIVAKASSAAKRMREEAEAIDTEGKEV